VHWDVDLQSAGRDRKWISSSSSSAAERGWNSGMRLRIEIFGVRIWLVRIFVVRY
jgi:hypothetical protein